MSEARGTLELRGSVIAQAFPGLGVINDLYFQVANAAGGEAVDLTPGETHIQYLDADQTIVLTDFTTVTGLGNADSDQLVEPGEIYEVHVGFIFTLLNPDLTKDKLFQLEVKPPKGAVLHIERRTPVVLESFMDLG